MSSLDYNDVFIQKKAENPALFLILMAEARQSAFFDDCLTGFYVIE